MNGKIAVRTLIYFVLTSLTNAILDTVLMLLIHPGNPHKKDVPGEETMDREAHILDGILDLGRLIYHLLHSCSPTSTPLIAIL